MPITLYRADTRPPEEIEAASGFTSRARALRQMPGADVDPQLAAARSVADNLINGTNAYELPENVCNGLQTMVANSKGATVGALDAVRAIKSEKSENTMHVSSDLTESCGGYASGMGPDRRHRITYKIELPTDRTYHAFEADDGGNGMRPKPLPMRAGEQSLQDGDASTMKPMLIMDAASPRDANIIALVGGGGAGAEMSFLTSIPMAWIKQCREQDLVARPAGQFKAWQDMDQALAARRQQQVAPAPENPPPPHPYAAPNHQHHALFSSALAGVQALGGQSPYNADEQTQQKAAAHLVHTAIRNKLGAIDAVICNNKNRLIAVEGDLHAVDSKRALVEKLDEFKQPEKGVQVAANATTQTATATHGHAFRQ